MYNNNRYMFQTISNRCCKFQYEFNYFIVDFIKTISCIQFMKMFDYTLATKSCFADP